VDWNNNENGRRPFNFVSAELTRSSRFLLKSKYSALQVSTINHGLVKDDSGKRNIAGLEM